MAFSNLFEVIFIYFILVVSLATKAARDCPGAPCENLNHCRSEFGFCDSSPAHCNERSQWNNTGCLLLPDNGCAGVPCLDPDHCRSAAGLCGQSPSECNENSLHRPEGCGTKSPTTSRPTASPTISRPTTSPTISRPTASPQMDDGAKDENNADTIDAVPIGIGGAVGGLAFTAFVVAAVGYRRRRREEKLLAEQWTTEEEKALRDAFQRTHDFEELCKVVPTRSRESVAVRAKFLLEPRRTAIFQSIMLRPMDGYTFLAERTRKYIPSAFKSRHATTTTSKTSFASSPSIIGFANSNGTMYYKGPNTVPEPVGMRVSENPLYFTGY